MGRMGCNREDIVFGAYDHNFQNKNIKKIGKIQSKCVIVGFS